MNIRKKIVILIIIIGISGYISLCKALGYSFNSSKDAIFLMDDFNIIGTPITAINGISGKGWDGSWIIPADNGIVSISNTSLTYPGSIKLKATGGHAFSSSPYGQGISRKLLQPISLGEEQSSFYTSFLTSKDATGNYRLEGITSTGSSSGFAIGITPDGRIKVNAGNLNGYAAATTQSEAGIIQNDLTYLIVTRYQYINSHVEVKTAVFKDGDFVPENDESVVWHYSATGGALSTSMHSIRMAFTKGLGRIDEFRLGSSWKSVTHLDLSTETPLVGTYRFPGFDWDDHPEQFIDPAKPVRYEIEIATDNQFSGLIDRDTVFLSRYVHTRPFNPGTYYWRTRSINYDSQISEWNDTLIFQIDEVQQTVMVPSPSGQNDCTASVKDAISQAQLLAAGGKAVKIVFPAGDYYFGNALEGEAIILNRVKNIEIEGTGARFHFSKRNQGLIKAIACENISISGISASYASGIFRVQGRVLAVNQSTRTMQLSIDEGSPDFSLSSDLNRDIFILLDPIVDGRVKKRSSNFYRMVNYSKNDNGTYSVVISEGGDITQWEAGDRFVYHFRQGSTNFVNFDESKNVTAYNLSTDGWGNMGFVSVKGSNFNILNCKTSIKPGNWMMGNADGVHIREHTTGPWIEDCEIQATGDDGVALYARPVSMSAIKPNGSENAAICVSEFFNLEAGDEVSFFQPTKGKILLETKVTSVVDLGGSFLVYFASPLPEGIITGSPLVDVTQIWNRSKSCGEFMIRKSKFINNRRYASVFRSRRGVIENSFYEGASSQAILFRNETAYPNGLYASEIILRNNSVIDCAFDGRGTQAPIAFYFEGRGTSIQNIGPKNILIENHFIKGCPSPEISLVGAENIVIRNNEVSLANGTLTDVSFSYNRSGNIRYSTLINSIKNHEVVAPLIYKVMATSGENGTISPAGEVTFFSNTNELFEFNPNVGYEVDNIALDGVFLGAMQSYTLRNVTQNHNLHVTFKKTTGVELVRPEADAYIHGGSFANTNFGIETGLIIKNSTNDNYKRKSIIKFNLKDITAPVTSAKLALKLASIDGASSTHNILFVEDDNWNETTINWNNSPVAGKILNSQTTPEKEKWVEFDITNQVETERSGDGQISLIIVDANISEVMTSYYSKESENSNIPQLILTSNPNNVEKNEFSPYIDVFPNPAKEKLSVQFNFTESALIKLLDCNGKLLFYVNEAKGTSTIPLANLKPGIYFLQISNHYISVFKKVVVN